MTCISVLLSVGTDICITSIVAATTSDLLYGIVFAVFFFLIIPIAGVMYYPLLPIILSPTQKKLDTVMIVLILDTVLR
jgi:hypothetical protein